MYLLITINGIQKKFILNDIFKTELLKITKKIRAFRKIAYRSYITNKINKSNKYEKMTD